MQPASAVRKGSLYPDHVVFLGAGVAVLENGEPPDDAIARIADERRPPPRLVLVPDAGALLPRGNNPSAPAMAGCLADVARALTQAIRSNPSRVRMNLRSSIGMQRNTGNN